MSKIFYSLLLLSITELPKKNQCYDGIIRVPDPYLDVVFQLDQSGSFEGYMYTEIFASLIEWIKSYLERSGSSSSQFAAILCCDNANICGVKHYFHDKNYSDAISAIFSALKQRGNVDNWASCTVHWAVEDVFLQNRGHRLNVTNIDIFITDCEFHMLLGQANASYIDAVKIFQAKVTGKLIFICAKNKETNGWAFNITSEPRDREYGYGYGPIWKNNILMLLRLNNQSEESIIYHVPNMSIVPAMDLIMPEVDIQYFDCKWNNTCTECLRQEKNELCFQHCNITIYQFNGPRHYGKPCPEELTDSLMRCNCTVNSEVGVVENRIPWEIVLGVLGTLLFIAILLVILFCFIRKRRQRKQRESRATQSKEGEEKNKGLGVEIQLLPAGTSQGVQSKEGPEKKKGVGVQIDVSKGAKTMSKSVSVEKLDNSPVKKDAKSTSKTVSVSDVRGKSPVKNNAKSTSKTVSAEVHSKSPVKNPPVTKGSKK